MIFKLQVKKPPFHFSWNFPSFFIHGASDNTLLHNKYSKGIPNTDKYELHLCILHNYSFIVWNTMTLNL